MDGKSRRNYYRMLNPSWTVFFSTSWLY